VGKGKVYVIRKDPKEFVLEPDKDKDFVGIIKTLYEQNTGNGKLEFKNYFYLNRGPYEIISVMDENSDQKPYMIKGKFIDLFDPEIPVIDQKQVQPGEQAFLFNIDKAKKSGKPQVLATAARVYDEKISKNQYAFTVKSPVNTTNVMRVLLPSETKTVSITDTQGNTLNESQNTWDEPSKTCFLSFENDPDGVKVTLTW
jgi:hypothetical protein